MAEGAKRRERKDPFAREKPVEAFRRSARLRHHAILAFMRESAANRITPICSTRPNVVVV
jgi:hypothetical protein